MCGDALADYWPKLERAQALADKALAKAKDAQSDLSSAKSRLSSADSWVTRATKEADKYKDDPTGSKSSADKPDEGKVRAATWAARGAFSTVPTATRPDGTIAAISDLLDGDRRVDRDASGRVTGVRAATWSERYAYDAAGNLNDGEWSNDLPVGPVRGAGRGTVRRAGTSPDGSYRRSRSPERAVRRPCARCGTGSGTVSAGAHAKCGEAEALSDAMKAGVDPGAE